MEIWFNFCLCLILLYRQKPPRKLFWGCNAKVASMFLNMQSRLVCLFSWKKETTVSEILFCRWIWLFLYLMLVIFVVFLFCRGASILRLVVIRRAKELLSSRWRIRICCFDVLFSIVVEMFWFSYGFLIDIFCYLKYLCDWQVKALLLLSISTCLHSLNSFDDFKNLYHFGLHKIIHCYDKIRCYIISASLCWC